MDNDKIKEVAKVIAEIWKKYDGIIIFDDEENKPKYVLVKIEKKHKSDK